MKTLTLLQAAALIILAVVGAHSSEDITHRCPEPTPDASCQVVR